MEEPSKTERYAASLPLAVRRRALRLQWRSDILRGRLRTFGLSPVFCDMLKVPLSASIEIDREAVYADRLCQLEWLAVLMRSPQQIVDDWRHVGLPCRETIEHVAASGRPVILAPIHMGCFALPFSRLIHDVFPTRPMLILRAREDRPVETQVMRRISEMGVDMRFLNVANKQDYIDAVRFARTGSVIVSFVDLPGSYGGPVATTFFGKTISLAMGLDTLARVTDAAVIPLSINSTPSGDVIHAGRPFEVSETGAESKQRVTKIVRDHMERAVLAAPGQWFMWPRLGEYLTEGAAGATLQ